MSTFIEQEHVTQPDSEPPRRVFTDREKHFSLVVWYEDNSLKQVVGFQLGFKSNPFDTDREYLFTLNPSDGDKLVRTSTTVAKQHGMAIKAIEDTDEQPPDEFEKKYEEISSSLPYGVKIFIDDHLNSKLV